MARTALTVQKIVVAGITPSYASGDATNDHSFANGRGDVFIHAKNTGGTAVVMTFPTPVTANQGLTIEDPTVSVPATTGDKMAGPFDPALFNQSDGSGVHLDLDVDTGFTLGAFRLPRVN